LKPQEIAIIPDYGNFIKNLLIPRNLGYHKADNQSHIAMKYLRWLSYKNGWNIQCHDSPEGEKRIRLRNGQLIRVDGFIDRLDGPDIVIEFLGCAWHGHDWYIF